MNRTASGAGRPRSAQLDVLRGIAILLVLGRHSMSASATAGPLRPLAGLWNRFGWTGVDLFFVLSGFLIGGLLFEELRARGRLDVRRFLIRRAFKIWPLYYLFLAASIALVLWRADGGPSPGARTGLGEFAPIALNVQNYLPPAHSRWHLWSLAVEEHFYLALPLALGWISRRSRAEPGDPAGPVPTVPMLVLGVIAACTALRLLAVARLPFDPRDHMFPTHLRADSLAFGVLLAYLRAFRPSLWRWGEERRGTLMIGGLALVCPMLFLAIEGSSFVPTVGYNLLYLGYGAILAASLATPPGRGPVGLLLHGRLGRAVGFVGLYSYPIYLWHIELGRHPAAWLFDTDARAGIPDPVRWSASMATYITLSIVAGVAMGRLVERPALALRERLFPGRTAAVDEAPARGPAPGDVPIMAVPTT